MHTSLSVKHLNKAFGSLQVTNDVNFNVYHGEILGLIGGNGAGKTTLFALTAGNLLPNSGYIEFRGQDITWKPPHERARMGLARTYQIPQPFSHMTVLENLTVAALFGGNMRLDEAEAHALTVARKTGLSDVLNLLAGRLPLLPRKRHELARALAMKPQLLLIDEVAAGLTDQEVNQLIDLVKAIKEEVSSIIWIEHVMKTMLTATDRLLVLDAGKIIATGEPREVVNSSEVRRVYLGA